MEVYKDLKAYNSKKPTAVTLGKFDGFHQGHQRLVDKIKEHASPEVDSLLLAFDVGGRGLLTKEEQQERMKDEVDVFILCPLSEHLKRMSPEEFVEEVLVKRLNVKVLVVGSDFRFGAQRRGNTQLLLACSRKWGFRLEVLPKKTDGGQVISSTLIKEALEKGEIERANHLLGVNYEISGIVSDGKKLGRTIGFPTLNIHPSKRKVIPKHGVYGCKVVIESAGDHDRQTDPEAKIETVDEKDEYQGICNIGIKPTATTKGEPVAEVHVFDFHEEAYGKKAKIKLLTFVRPEKKFGSIEGLREQIARDIHQVKKNDA